MKIKILLLGFLLFAITLSFGQAKTGNGNKGVSGTATGDWQPNRQVTPATSGNYGNTNQGQNSVGGTWEGNKWISNWMQNDCFSGIKYKVINYNLTNSNGAHWGIMVQNTYGQPASFKFKLTVGGTIWAGDGWDDAYMLGSGKVYTHSNSLVTAMTFNSNSTTFQVDIKDVKLNDNPIDCQGRILPKIINKNANNQSAAVAEHDRIYGTNSTNQNTTQNNQQAEQQRIQQENQRIAQENQRRAEEERQKKLQQQQQYNNSYNQATNSLANKDYNTAIQNYGEAGKNATTKSETNLAVTGVVASGTLAIFDAFAKAKEEKRERERQEAEKKERELQQMKADWSNAINLANHEDYTQAIKLMLPYAYSDKLNGMALNTIGFWYWKLSDYANALIWYKKSAGKKVANAYYNLGVMYENGWAAERDLNTALQWYNDACKNGYNQGCENYQRLIPIADAEATQKKAEIENADATVGYVIPFFKNGKFGFENATTKEVKISEKYSEVSIFSNGLALAKLGDKFGYIDKLGNVAIPFKYTNAHDFIDGVAVVATDTQKGTSGTVHNVRYEIIDVTGKTIAKYFLIRDFKDGLARARLDEKKWGFIDKNGTVVIPFNYSDIDDFSEDLAKVRIWNGKDFKYGFIDKTGTIVIPAKYEYFTEGFSEGMAKVKINNKYGFIDKSGKLLVPAKYELFTKGFKEGLAAVKKGKKYGFIDKNGREIIPLKYQDVGSFSDGLAYVALKDKWGYIDKNGTEVIPLIYEMCWPFKDGLAAVMLNGKWGCIDKTGKVVIPIKYEIKWAYPLQFQNGFATIKINERIGKIDKEGNEYW